MQSHKFVYRPAEEESLELTGTVYPDEGPQNAFEPLDEVSSSISSPFLSFIEILSCGSYTQVTGMQFNLQILVAVR